MQVPKAPKKHQGLDVFLAHLGSSCLKAVHKMLMKLAPGGRDLLPTYLGSLK